MKRNATSYFLIVALALAAHTLASSQTVAPKHFAAIPRKSRAQLFNRLSLLTKYQRNENGGQLYDMLFGNVPGKFSRLQFIQGVRGCHARAFLGFRSRSIDKSFNDDFPEADWRIVGTATVRDAGVVHEETAFVFAKLVNHRWFFSGIIIPIVDRNLGGAIEQVVGPARR